MDLTKQTKTNRVVLFVTHRKNAFTLSFSLYDSLPLLFLTKRANPTLM